ncbi:sensor histidine kinase [Catenuloplanes niger]|uniref:histidine kinase n=1 Tax=Catenuloplanes niger TaxID=587534 RepID=A0AAE4CPD0_9ACTN|nr:histidine kinase [Catenuloplanes niger]MDR7319780.1 signal transduction histidine kinase [Catenuloplanes niger]
MPRQWWLVVGALAGMLLVGTATVMTDVYGVALLISWAAATAQCGALALTLTRPRIATVLQLAAVAVFAFAQQGSAGIWPFQPPVMLTMVVHVALIGLRWPWREAVVIWWISALFGILLATVDPRGRTLEVGDTALITYATNSVMVLFGTIAWRQRGAVRRELAQARRDVELEQAQRALVEERNRIARELHDVVAHSMSVIHMQATSAVYRFPDIDPEPRAEFGRIAAGTRATLREMRALLALLRDESADTEARPQPDLRDLGELAESARRGGVPVTLDVTGDAGDGTVGLAAYRIVQESLSNVIRHAPGADTRVRVAVERGELLVEVVNGPPAAVPRLIEEPARAGHGLVGMRERARLAGGHVRTGAQPDGGYRVTARLPLSGDPLVPSAGPAAHPAVEEGAA